MVERIPVAVLGATGSVGQRFVQLLANHPWFELVALTGSELSEGQRYGERVHWILDTPLPERYARMPLQASDATQLPVRLAFSALPANAARQIEPLFAQAGITVCSNASAFRQDEDVPLLIPEVNPQHATLLSVQRLRRGWTGGIVTNPNCTSTGLTVALKALDDAFGVKRGVIVSLQALSGAGYPGVASLDILDNVIPYIGGEEEKVEWEPRKMLGSLHNDTIRLHAVQLSAHCNRVAVSDGHLVVASLELSQPASPQAAAEALAEYQAPDLSRGLPSTPDPIIAVRNEADRPQPRLDRLTGAGMTTVVGRVRPDNLFDLRLAVLSHNTIRGAAGGSIYNAELLIKLGLVNL